MDIEILNENLTQYNNDNLLNLLNKYEQCTIRWKCYITERFKYIDTSYEKIALRIGFSKNTIKKWCNNGTLPQNRDAFIKLSFALKMNLKETNELLTTYGRYSSLYPKDIYDAITIYIINKRQNDFSNIKYNYEALKQWHDRYKYIIESRKINDKYYNEKNTIGVYETLCKIKEEKEFQEFIELNEVMFFSSHSKLIYYIEEFIEIRKEEYRLLYDEKSSLHKWINNQKINPIFEKIISNLKINGILPERKYLIALGIHLNMTLFEINKMLSLANMINLYPKDKLECALIYLLITATKIDPDLSLNNAFKMKNITQNPQWRREYIEIILSYFENTNMDEYQNCIEKLSSYITIELNKLDLDDENFNELLLLLRPIV